MLLKNTAVLAVLSTKPAAAQTTTDCLLPSALNPYFQKALDDISSIFETRIVSGLNDIGLGPIASLRIQDLVDFKQEIFDPLFGDAVERDAWINVTEAIDVKNRLESNLDNVIGSIPPELSMTCEIVPTDDLEADELPYRFVMEFVLGGSVLGSDLDLTALSPSIAVLPEDTYDPLSLSVETLTADYVLRMPLTLDAKRRKFMIGEITATFDAAMSTNVLQSIPLTESVSQNFQGALDMNFALAFSTISDWSYVADFEARLAAESSVGTEVAELALIVEDDDLFDDKPREFLHVLSISYAQIRR